MKVFLTSGTGFLGGRLAARLVEAGHEVRALVRRTSAGRPLP
ncbi:MAG TPA: NAD-dependent epimerase/dehydratase family protein, partial [Candidatus Polarisedimenticolia bacterium]|nr:NAD-dependent epimerase/dehydratase family protein [Candidatus Polarisedimenticolia bacterium]